MRTAAWKAAKKSMIQNQNADAPIFRSAKSKDFREPVGQAREAIERSSLPDDDVLK